MKYIALLTGHGEGCDYTIGCNKHFVSIEAEDDNAALEKCKRLWENHGGAHGDPGVEDIELHVVTRTISVPVSQWEKEEKKQAERKQAEQELQMIESRAAELRAKLGKD